MSFKREISYSRNVFLPVTNLCRNRCFYCGFRKDPGDGAWFMSPEEVLQLARLGKRAGCTEALITLGEHPEVYPLAREKLDELGYRTTVDYLVDLCKQILEIGLLPHTNAGVLKPSELQRLRRYNASMGLMLETTAHLPAHSMSPGKEPKLRLATIEAAGKLNIPFTTGLLVGIGEGPDDRLQSLLEIKKLHERYRHIQEIIIQPFDPKPGTLMQSWQSPDEKTLLTTVALARATLTDVSVQVPPNLLSLNGSVAQPGGPEFNAAVSRAISAGASDFGGISPVTPDFINFDHPWPSLAQLRAAIASAGRIPRERLPIYPRFINEERFMSSEVKKLVLELADEEGYRAEAV
ncbi:MAG: 7,8-didemethyl-8-hydroxy-5-deazariboflavin synthase subunit CofG [Candidatus Hadarchaeum sp.]|uniref:7,8-didemethyl-8-hydroxy-5-deazariboflavin synthase subunit CofG n=1 Tax=Candidatus Hadarchaeum sp. TaxID=2883567 RepID=UPI0031759513